MMDALCVFQDHKSIQVKNWFTITYKLYTKSHKLESASHANGKKNERL